MRVSGIQLHTVDGEVAASLAEDVSGPTVSRFRESGLTPQANIFRVRRPDLYTLTEQ